MKGWFLRPSVVMKRIAEDDRWDPSGPQSSDDGSGGIGVSDHRMASAYVSPFPVEPATPKPFYETAKRVCDFLGALLCLLLGAPVFLLIAFLVKATSPGPVIYRHRRLGQDGEEFDCYKFRTMRADAEQYLQRNPELLRQFQEQGYKLKNDPRITAVGNILRKTSLDELPQILNVLRGEMSFVGPRPIVTPELEEYGLYGKRFLSVKPGITGLWQALGRSDTTYSERVHLDMIYVDARSLWIDFQIVVLTVIAVVWRKGAY